MCNPRAEFAEGNPEDRRQIVFRIDSFDSVTLLHLFLCHVGLPDSDYDDSDGMSSMSVYYDVDSRLPLRLTSIQNSLSASFGDSGQSATKTIIFRRFGYRSNGCTCQELTCGCCAGFNLQQINFNREGKLLPDSC